MSYCFKERLVVVLLKYFEKCFISSEKVEGKWYAQFSSIIDILKIYDTGDYLIIKGFFIEANACEVQKQ